MKYVNLAGILLLVGLSLVQWRNNRHWNLRADQLERTRLEQADKLADQQHAIAGLNSDLEEFRTRLAKAGAELAELRKQFAQAASDRDAMKSRSEQLQANLTAAEENRKGWQAAVAERDAAIAKAGGEIEKIAGERNDAISRFNALATRYNEMVKQKG